MGYCYREEPDGGWDSGWRFTAGDESDEYMDDPNNAGIYKPVYYTHLRLAVRWDWGSIGV